MGFLLLLLFHSPMGEKLKDGVTSFVVLNSPYIFARVLWNDRRDSSDENDTKHAHTRVYPNYRSLPEKINVTPKAKKSG